VQRSIFDGSFDHRGIRTRSMSQWVIVFTCTWEVRRNEAADTRLINCRSTWLAVGQRDYPTDRQTNCRWNCTCTEQAVWGGHSSRSTLASWYLSNVSKCLLWVGRSATMMTNANSWTSIYIINILNIDNFSMEEWVGLKRRTWTETASHTGL